MRLVTMMLLLAGGAGSARALAAQSEGDAAAREAITAEVRGFYRDLTAGRTAALLDHFWPSKITARWEPPVADAHWAAPSATASASPGSGSRAACVAGSEPQVALVGRWARVLISDCDPPSAGSDELWLLEVNGRWKIVRLVLGEGRNDD